MISGRVPMMVRSLSFCIEWNADFYWNTDPPVGGQVKRIGRNYTKKKDMNTDPACAGRVRRIYTDFYWNTDPLVGGQVKRIYIDFYLNTDPPVGGQVKRIGRIKTDFKIFICDDPFDPSRTCGICVLFVICILFVICVLFVIRVLTLYL